MKEAGLHARILLAESDPQFRQTVLALLAGENFTLDLASDGLSAFEKASAGDFDLIVLDAALTFKNGFLVCDELRRKGIDTSILMLTAKSRIEDRVTALRLGADDCVSRNCDWNELLARVEALLRRVPKTRPNPIATLRFGDVEIDFGISEVHKAGSRINLAAKELRLLQYLVDHRERVVSRQEILRKVWEYDSAVTSRTIDVHIGWLRQKLEDNPQNPKYIKTIRGRGYRFDCEDPARHSHA